MHDSDDDVETIRREMQKVRRDVGEDVDGIIRSAQEIADWRSYLRKYPWLCLGAAAAAGYFIVPRRLHVIRPDPATLLELARRQKLVVTDQPAPPPGNRMMGTLLAFAGSMAARAAKSYFQQAFGGQAGGSSGFSRPGPAAM